MARKQEENRPLVVCDETGKFLFLSRTNPKGYSKSIKQKTLWAYHPETEALSPNGYTGQLKKIEDRGDYYYAEVALDPSISHLIAEDTLKGGSPKEETSSSCLEELVKHLQKQKHGWSLDTLRKRMGENALQLILASNREHLLSEGADLVYHLFMLLEKENLPLSEVWKEIEARLKEGGA